MAIGLESFPLLKTAEQLGDDIWKVTGQWQRFDREVMGSQIIRATDSIGANLAESYGRFHYGEKLQLYLFNK